jgi:hypothetical protein
MMWMARNHLVSYRRTPHRKSELHLAVVDGERMSCIVHQKITAIQVQGPIRFLDQIFLKHLHSQAMC